MRSIRRAALLVVLVALAALAAPIASASAAAPTVGVIDEALVSPQPWAPTCAPAWSAASVLATYTAQGYTGEVLGANDLNLARLRQFDVIVIPGNHVYPENGAWNGSVLQALADYVQQGGIYVMPIGISHWTSRDINDGSQSVGHFGPDRLGLTFDIPNGTAPVSLTAQGGSLGLPPLVDTTRRPMRGIAGLDATNAAILARGANGVPALSAKPRGSGWVLHSGIDGTDRFDATLASWFYNSTAIIAKAARTGVLQLGTGTAGMQAQWDALRAAAPKVGVIDDALVRPVAWPESCPDAWTANAELTSYLAAGFQGEVIGASDLTPAGFGRFNVIAVPGNHVYPERGAWGGPVIQAIKAFTDAGGVYVAPLGIPQWTARDVTTQAADSGHFGPDIFGLNWRVASGAAPITATLQGGQVGVTSPTTASASVVRENDAAGNRAILAWDANHLPALEVRRSGSGTFVTSGTIAPLAGTSDTMDHRYAAWWYRAGALAAKAALAGNLRYIGLAATYAENGVVAQSLGDVDKGQFAPAPGPMESPATTTTLTTGTALSGGEPSTLSLDGTWSMVEREPGAGTEAEFVTGSSGWVGALPATVPGTVHQALLAAGQIPEPTTGKNSLIAKDHSYKDFWMRRTFNRPAGMAGKPVRLSFDGLDYTGTVYLNGTKLGSHEGPYGGPDYDVGPLLQATNNQLVVHLDRNPAVCFWPEAFACPPGGPTDTAGNTVFKATVVFGWHYVNLPTLGISRSVRLRAVAPVEIKDPFVATTDYQTGTVDLVVDLQGPASPWHVTLRGSIAPDNFTGSAQRFDQDVVSSGGTKRLHLRMTIPNRQLWWPNEYGAQKLYRMRLQSVPAGTTTPADATEVRFGIRQVQMQPAGEVPHPNEYNWRLVVNGRQIPIKGANWSLTDPLRRDTRTGGNARLMKLFAAQHGNLLRAWGGGDIETERFYDLADTLGLLVYQEWPFSGGNIRDAKLPLVAEQTTRNILRLRNRASLAMWGGGNELGGYDPAIGVFGKLAWELDGTRAVHRSDPMGGSVHDHDVFWRTAGLDYNQTLGGVVMLNEFGMPAPPILRSVLRYIPPAEQSATPTTSPSFLHHLPIYNAGNEISTVTYYASKFVSDPDSFAGATTGMEIAQAIAQRAPTERQRISWPRSTGFMYYKLNVDNPGMYWDVIDWYGSPKMAYHTLRQAMAPLQAIATFDRLNPQGSAWSSDIHIVDDLGTLSGAWSVKATVYDGNFGTVKTATFNGTGTIDRVRKLGQLSLTAAETASTPLFLVLEIQRAGQPTIRNTYFLNYEAQVGSLFNRPSTTLSVTPNSSTSVTVTNTGAVPAVETQLYGPDSDAFETEDSFFWLAPGESRTLQVSDSTGVKAMAWNAGLPNTLTIPAANRAP